MGSSKKFYITTAIDYVNAPPHIGHALEKIQADVLARYYRARGRDVFFLTGTDEHGATNVRGAKKAGEQVEEFTEKISARFRAFKEALNLSWDDFIRTSDKIRHWPGAQLMWKKLVESGDIYKKSYKGLYCVGHEAFITEKELIDGKCPEHRTQPEVTEEENYFFRLSKYSKDIGDKIRKNELKIVPESRKNEILSLIDKEGLEDVSFSRPKSVLSWGIPVPGDEMETMYVWCDALTNYLTAIGFGRNDDWKKLWPADIQVIGKNILRFHAAIWPGMLISAGIHLPKKLFVHGFLTIDGEKMSKTIGNVVDPFEIVKKYGTDAVRYYLLREIPAYEDGDFSIPKLESLYNADLANGLGNFTARVLALAEVIDFDGQNLKPEDHIDFQIRGARDSVYEKIEGFKLHEALAAIWHLIGFGDAYINHEAPWEIRDTKKKSQIIFNLVVILDNVAAILKPFLPETSQKITKSIEWHGNTIKINRGEVLFPRLPH